MSKPNAQVKLICTICNAPIADSRLACAARPLNEGKCCPSCDDLIVTPVRIARAGEMTLLKAIETGIAIYKTMAEIGLRPKR
jgi:hypothetical protein